MTDPADNFSGQTSLYGLARACQQGHAAWHAAEDVATRQLLRDEHRGLLELLWQALQPDLERGALRWRRSGMAPDLRSLAMGMFVHIIGELPRLRLDPDRNVRHLLLMVAQRRTVDEYRRSFSDGPHMRGADDALPIASGAPEAQMWAEPSGPVDLFALDREQELVDPQTLDAESQIVARLDLRRLVEQLWRYWPERLSLHDLQIMRLRWRVEPPVPFSEIARQLGDGWEEDTVRQRHHRILRDARRFLAQGKGFEV